MVFEHLETRLLDLVKDRICQGEITVRALARLSGISQPHLHNVLKGTKTLSRESCDLLLRSVRLSVLDLVTEEELRSQFEKLSTPREILYEKPLLAGLVGPGHPWPATMNWPDRVRIPILPSRSTKDLVVFRLGEDAEMPTSLHGCNIAAADTSIAARERPLPVGLYVVNRGEDTVLRYVRRGWQALYLIRDGEQEQGACWQALSYGANCDPRAITDILLGQVCWLGRTELRKMPRIQSGQLAMEATSA